MRSVMAFVALLVPVAGLGQSATPVVLPSGTPLWVKTGDTTIPLRDGQPVQGKLMYPVYAENEMVLPAGTRVEGLISGLEADHKHRVEARLRGDFTPFSRPVVQFRELILADGEHVPLVVGPAVDGAPVMQLTPPPERKGGFLRREFDTGVALVKDRVRLVTAPGKTDRLKQLLYSQLPYHPQRIAAGTVWTVDTTADTEMASVPASPPAGIVPVALASGADGGPKSWTLQAYLSETLSSEKTKVGEPIRAVVAQPVLGADGAVEVPQGAVLEGKITSARPARRFGRAGELRFDFRELSFPGEPEKQSVETALSGVDAIGGANLALDREGKVKPKPQDKLVVPFILLTLAGRPLDRDRGDNAFGKDAVASNSLGVLGFIVGTAAGYRNIAAGIGYYGSALAIWNRWIKRGAETTLRKDTRLVVQTTARRSPPMRKSVAGAALLR